MAKKKDTSLLASIGGLIAIYGLASILLNFINYNLTILMWIDSWGEAIGWAIRIGLVVLGGVLFFVGGGIGGKKKEKTTDSEE